MIGEETLQAGLLMRGSNEEIEGAVPKLEASGQAISLEGFQVNGIG